MWKKYRGGQTARIWLARLSDSTVTKVPRTNSNDFNPMWAGDRVFFLSDRNGPATLFSYDVKTKAVKEAIANQGLDMKSASLGPDAIVDEQSGGASAPAPKPGGGEVKKIALKCGFYHAPRFSPDSKKIAIMDSFMRLSYLDIETAKQVDIDQDTYQMRTGDIAGTWSPDSKWLAYSKVLPN